MRKHTVRIYLSIVLFCMLIQGFRMPAHATKGESIRIKDTTGGPVEVRLPIRKVVILNSDVLEVIRALNAEDLVVGVNSGISISPSFWPGLKNIPSVGRWMEPNYELIAELNPDIVIGYARHPAPDMEKKLMPFGITVIRLDFYKIRALIEEVKILGRILGREEEALKLTTWYRKNLSSIRGSIRDISDRPDVYIESYSRYHTTGPDSGGHEMSILAGGHNIASDFSIPYPEITPEWILANNPHVIIKATALRNCYSITDPRSLKIIRDEITDRTAWDNIQAVQEDRVYVMTSDIWTGPRAIIGIGYMAKWFHPDLFKNLDPEKLHREYLEKFQGIKYQGVYVYPGKVPEVISELK